jgi:CheY-like chemotaxis protein
MNSDTPPADGVRILLVQENVVGGVHLRLAVEFSGLRPALSVIDHRVEAVRAVAADIRSGAGLPDLILAEVDMCEEPGRQIVHTIRATSELAEVPLVVIGPGERAEELRWARELGAHGFIARPARASDLHRVGREIANAWSCRGLVMN